MPGEVFPEFVSAGIEGVEKVILRSEIKIAIRSDGRARGYAAARVEIPQFAAIRRVESIKLIVP